MNAMINIRKQMRRIGATAKCFVILSRIVREANNQKQAHCSQALWFHGNVAGSAAEVGTVFGCDDLEALRDVVNDRCGAIFSLIKTGHAGLSALRASQLFVPSIERLKIIDRIIRP